MGLLISSDTLVSRDGDGDGIMLVVLAVICVVGGRLPQCSSACLKMSICNDHDDVPIATVKEM